MATYNIRTTCPHCGARFGGRSAHCPTCHQTFSGDTAYDAHLESLVHAGCRNPRTYTHPKQGHLMFRWDNTLKVWRTNNPNKKPSPFAK